MHRTGDTSIAVGNGRYLAEHIPGARYVEFSGDDHVPFTDIQDDVLDEVERFLTGTTVAPLPERILATFLCTEIVGAMAQAVAMGDERWSQIMEAHDQLTSALAEQHRGRLASRGTAGAILTFDGPARAIRCATTLTRRARELGIDVRAGLHTGECELRVGEVTGVAVQIATRVVARANAGEVVVSSTVVDLVAGSGIAFERLEHQLVAAGGRGIELYRVADAFGAPATAGVEPVRVAPDAAPLSPREREVAIQIGRGLSNRMIADELSISVATVERHAANIFNKLGVRSRTQVAVWVASEGLLRSRAN
jgi:class 3 adenylate cyclase